MAAIIPTTVLSRDATPQLGGNLDPNSKQVDGQWIVDHTNAEALLIRKDSDGGDVLTVDTTNSLITFNRARDNASNKMLTLKGNSRTTPADNDEAYFSHTLEADDGNQNEVGRMNWVFSDVTLGSMQSRFSWEVLKGASLTEALSVGSDVSGNLEVRMPNDDQPLMQGAADDYKQEWDGTNEVYTISAGNFTFTGGNLGVNQATPLGRIHTVGNSPVFDVTGAASAYHSLFIGEGAPTDWRAYAGSTTAALQIQTSSSRGIVLTPQSTGNTRLMTTNGWDIYTNATVGTNSGTLALVVGSDQNLTVYGDINPDTDSSKDLGTQTSGQWANLWADLVNGADISLSNGWRMLESEKYEGHAPGFAIGNTHFKPGVVTEKMPADAEPVFAITEDYIEYKGRRVTFNLLYKLMELAGA